MSIRLKVDPPPAPDKEAIRLKKQELLENTSGPEWSVAARTKGLTLEEFLDWLAETELRNERS